MMNWFKATLMFLFMLGYVSFSQDYVYKESGAQIEDVSIFKKANIDINLNRLIEHDSIIKAQNSSLTLHDYFKVQVDTLDSLEGFRISYALYNGDSLVTREVSELSDANGFLDNSISPLSIINAQNGSYKIEYLEAGHKDYRVNLLNNISELNLILTEVQPIRRNSGLSIEKYEALGVIKGGKGVKLQVGPLVDLEAKAQLLSTKVGTSLGVNLELNSELNTDGGIEDLGLSIEGSTSTFVNVDGPSAAAGISVGDLGGLSVLKLEASAETANADLNLNGRLKIEYSRGTDDYYYLQVLYRILEKAAQKNKNDFATSSGSKFTFSRSKLMLFELLHLYLASQNSIPFDDFTSPRLGTAIGISGRFSADLGLRTGVDLELIGNTFGGRIETGAMAGLDVFAGLQTGYTKWKDEMVLESAISAQMRYDLGTFLNIDYVGKSNEEISSGQDLLEIVNNNGLNTFNSYNGKYSLFELRNYHKIGEPKYLGSEIEWGHEFRLKSDLYSTRSTVIAISPEALNHISKSKVNNFVSSYISGQYDKYPFELDKTSPIVNVMETLGHLTDGGETFIKPDQLTAKTFKTVSSSSQFKLPFSFELAIGVGISVDLGLEFDGWNQSTFHESTYAYSRDKNMLVPLIESSIPNKLLVESFTADKNKELRFLRDAMLNDISLVKSRLYELRNRIITRTAKKFIKGSKITFSLINSERKSNGSIVNSGLNSLASSNFNLAKISHGFSVQSEATSSNNNTNEITSFRVDFNPSLELFPDGTELALESFFTDGEIYIRDSNDSAFIAFTDFYDLSAIGETEEVYDSTLVSTYSIKTNLGTKDKRFAKTLSREGSIGLYFKQTSDSVWYKVKTVNSLDEIEFSNNLIGSYVYGVSFYEENDFTKPQVNIQMPEPSKSNDGEIEISWNDNVGVNQSSVYVQLDSVRRVPGLTDSLMTVSVDELPKYKSDALLVVSVSDHNGNRQLEILSADSVERYPLRIYLESNLIEENSGPDTFVSKLNTVDYDYYDSHIYTLNDSSVFFIREDSLFSKTPLNYELDSLLSIIVTSKDTRGLLMTDTLNIEVLDVNDPPILANGNMDIGICINEELNEFLLIDTFTDEDEDNLSYSLSGLPSGFRFNKDDLSITGLSTNEIDEIQLVLSAKDERGGMAKDTLLFRVDIPSDPSFSYKSTDYCVNSTNPSPSITGALGGTFSSTSGLSLDASTGVIDISTSTAGSYTVTYTTSGYCPQSSAETITIIALDDASFSYSSAAYCIDGEDPVPAIAGTAGGTFGSTAGLSLDVSTGVIDVSASTAGSYDVTYTTSGDCPQSYTETVTINGLDDASFSYSSAAYCVDSTNPTPTITGTTGGTFSSTSGLSLDASTGVIDVSTSTAGSYEVTYTTSGDCPQSSTETVTINGLDDASFSYSSAAYCVDTTDPTPTITGTEGGTFSSTAGLSLDASTGVIDVSASTVGSYVVTYTTNGNCPQNSTETVTINGLDDASFSYSSPAYCVDTADPTPTITGTEGGTFSSTAGLSLDASTGVIDVSTSTAGSYTVTYTTNGDCPQSSTETVTLNGLDDASFSYSSAAYCVCDDNEPSPIIGGTAGGTFSAENGLVLNAESGQITLCDSEPGNYTITYETNGECPQSSTFDITILPMDDPEFTYDSDSYCKDTENPIPTANTEGGTYDGSDGLEVDSGTGEIDLEQSTAGDHVVTYTTNGACPESSTFDITILPIDDPEFTYDSNSYCKDTENPIPTANTEGGTYDGSDGLEVDSGTGEIDLEQSSAGDHVVTYTTNGACPESSTFDITILPMDDPEFTYDSDSFCKDIENPIPTSNTEGGTYDGSDGLEVDSGTGEIDLEQSLAGDHVVTYTTNGACPQSSTFDITILPLDDPSFDYGNDLFCKNGNNPTPDISGLNGGTFTASSSELIFVDESTGVIDILNTPAGTYTITYTTNGDCPQVSDPAEITVQEVDSTVSQDLLLLSAGQSAGIYQWLDCSNGGSEIEGATNRGFTPTSNGSYAVQVTLNGCTVTSECVEFLITDIQIDDISSKVKVYPNPSDGKYTIDLGSVYRDITLAITDPAGRTVKYLSFENQQELSFELDSSEKVFFANILADGKRASKTLLKNKPDEK